MEAPERRSPALTRSTRSWPDWPHYGLTDDLYPSLFDWMASGRRFALATLVEVIGSSPRPVGSEMAIRDDGWAVGYLSGGCVEAAVAAEALAVLAEGRPRLLDYGHGSPIVDLRLSCGGRIRILVREPPESARLVEMLAQARRARRALSMVTELASGAWSLIGSDGTPDSLSADGRFLKTYTPVVRLVVVGGDPVALALAQLALAFGYEVHLLRPSGPPAPPAPGLAYHPRPLEVALGEVSLDAFTAVTSLSHDAETDLAVLAHALTSPAFHVSSIGSRRKAEAKQARLRELGFDDAAIARVHTPAGLHLGSVTPREIALSILAQMIVDRRAPGA